MKARGLVDSGPTDRLLRCLSARVEPDFYDRVGRSSSNDWNEVVDVAVQHNLAPLLFKRLKTSDARDHVPSDAWERLRLAYFANAGRNVRLFRELRTVLGCLRSHDIPVIVLKGAFLAEAVYGDIAIRPMCDADLMVPRTELPRALAVLLDIGGVQRQSENVKFWGRHQHLLPVVFRGLPVELHYTIVPSTEPLTIDVTGLWDRAHPATIAGAEVLALSPEDLLLHLCLHFCYLDRLLGLKSFCDIAETTRRFRGEMNWPQVVDRAREWGAARYLGLTLYLTERILGTEVPADVLERLVPGGLDPRMLETAGRFVLTQTGYDQSAGRPAFELQEVRSLGDKGKLFSERVFLSRAEMAATYPASRDARHLYFYYVLRLRDVIRTFFFQTLRRGLWVMLRSRGPDREASLVNWLKSGKP